MEMSRGFRRFFPDHRRPWYRRRVRATSRFALAVGLALVAGPRPVLAKPAAQVQSQGSPTQGADPVQAAPSAEPPVDPAGRYRACKPGRRWLCCAPGEPCIRSGAARLLLLSLGAIAGGVAGGLLFGLGDRLAGGDPATLLVGTGALAGAGAIVGSVVGRLGGDAPGDPDRIRPITVGLQSDIGATRTLDEVDPSSLGAVFAPTWFFGHGHGRLRLLGHVGGDLISQKEVDPRPQLMSPGAGEEGTRPVTFTDRELSIGLALDLAVAMPYPVLPARWAGFLGPAELRYKPEVQIRRHDVGLAGQERTIERTMLLPLTVGARWHLSQRQRFTIYVGPRFDIVSAARADGELERGGAEIGPLYGEAWYDIDFPFTRLPRKDGEPRRARVNGQLSVGYVHSRFDGRGIEFGPVIGFLGPLVGWWHTRVRPAGWPVALQGGVGVAIGNGVTTSVRLGVVLPDIRSKERR